MLRRGGQKQARRAKRTCGKHDLRRGEREGFAVARNLDMGDAVGRTAETAHLGTVEKGGIAGGKRRVHPGRAAIHLAGFGAFDAQALMATRQIADRGVQAVGV